MGMSASQARLLSLQGRMSDVEYQGQQINQQRTTLAGQINALYNNLLEMDVPTPPSTLDFKKTTYTGVTGATKFAMNNIIPTGNNTYSIDFAYQLAGHSFQKSSTSAKLTPAEPELYFKEVGDDTYKINNPIKTYTEPTTNTSVNTIEDLKELATKGVTDNKADNLLVKMSVKDYNRLIASGAPIGQSYYLENKKDDTTYLTKEADLSNIPEDDETNTFIYLQVNAGDLIDPKFKDLAALCGISFDEEGSAVIPEGGELSNIYNTDFEDRGEDINNYTEFLPDSYIVNLGLYIIDDSDKAVGINDAKELEKYINKGMRIYQQVYNSAESTRSIDNSAYDAKSSCPYQVGNMPVYSLADKTAIAKIGENTYPDYLEGLRHSFPDLASLSDEELANKFYVYFEPGINGASPKAHFIKVDEIGKIQDGNAKNVQTYDYDAAGTYTSTKKTTGCELEFDEQGRITRVGIPNPDGQITYVKVEFTTVTDEEAYEDAMNQYEYRKHLYDQKQQEINAKTSIIQAEDKSLELKLTRLDNERNALNTEIEAVKKVIQDSIDKGFKTFSG